MQSRQSAVSDGRVAVLALGLAVVMVGVVAAGGLLARKVERTADAAPAASPVPSPTTAAAATPVPSVLPSRNPRRQPDVDRGRPLAEGVFVEVANGWKEELYGYSALEVSSWDRGAAAAFYLSSRPLPSRPLLRPDVEAFAEKEQIHGLRAGSVRTLPLPNSNIAEAMSVSFTGRRRTDDATFSLSGECVRLRGVPAINDVSLSICWAAYVQDLDTVRPEVQRMIASAARSI